MVVHSYNLYIRELCIWLRSEGLCGKILVICLCLYSKRKITFRDSGTFRARTEISISLEVCRGLHAVLLCNGTVVIVVIYLFLRAQANNFGPYTMHDLSLPSPEICGHLVHR
jgi:hypothetical protein